MSNGINSPYGLKAVESVSGDGATRKMKSYRLAVDPITGATTAGPLYYGDPVKFQPAGGAGSFIGGINIVSALTPNVGAAATPIAGGFLGTFIGCTYQLPNQARITESNFWPGNLTVALGTSVIIYVNDDPNTVFQVQMSTSNDNSVVVQQELNTAPSVFRPWMVGQNANLQLGGVNFANAGSLANLPTNNPATGNTINSRSGIYLDGSSINPLFANKGNPTYDVKIIGLAPSAYLPLPSPQPAAGVVALTPGNNMPFCDVLIKFNVHVFGGPGVAGPYNIN